MDAQELMKELKRYPPDTEVVIDSASCCFGHHARRGVTVTECSRVNSRSMWGEDFIPTNPEREADDAVRTLVLHDAEDPPYETPKPPDPHRYTDVPIVRADRVTRRDRLTGLQQRLSLVDIDVPRDTITVSVRGRRDQVLGHVEEIEINGDVITGTIVTKEPHGMDGLGEARGEIRVDEATVDKDGVLVIESATLVAVTVKKEE